MNKGDQFLQASEEKIVATVLGYLTGSLSPEERASFEQRLLEDEFFSAQVEQAEFLLVEMYADGSLVGSARERVGAWIAASSRHRSQAAIATALRRSALKQPKPRAGWVVAFAAIAAGLAAAVFLLLLHPWRSRQPVLQPAAQTASIAVPRSVPEAPAQQDTILLVAEQIRGAESAIPNLYRIHTSSAVRLQILVPGPHAAGPYTLELKQVTPQAAAPMHFSDLSFQGPPSARYVEAQLPPHSMAAGLYEADLRARSESFKLQFQVAISK